MRVKLDDGETMHQARPLVWTSSSKPGAQFDLCPFSKHDVADTARWTQVQCFIRKWILETIGS